MDKFSTGFFGRMQKFQKGNHYRIDTLVLIIYNYFMVFLIANKNMEWTFHPFKADFFADKYGLVLDRPVILSKFGLVFRGLTLLCNLFGLLPIIRPKKQFRKYLIPVLAWNVYTVTALVENVLQILISITYLQVPVKVIASVIVSGAFVTVLYLKLILQVVNFHNYLRLVE